MRNAFGVDKESKFAGLLESEGLPAAGYVTSLRTLPPEKAADRTTPPRRDQSSAFGLTETGEPDHVGLAVASLRQALPDMPDIAVLSKSVVIVRSDQDLDLSIVDQDGRSLVPDGSTGPNERTRRLLETLAPTLRQMPNRIAVTGFAATDDRFASVSGRADTEAMFPDNPYLAANRRVTVTLLKEASPVPNVKGLP
jgi:chemotaxis protein MotB